jgi:uroporphyrinogen-III synthase
VRSAGGDGVALARLVAGHCDPAGPPLLLPGQEGQGAALAARLEAAGFAVSARAVYRLDRVSALPDAARRALERGEVEAALFFSPASARDFVALAGVVPLAWFSRIESLAISPATATELASLPWRKIRVAPVPDQDSLLGLLS